MGKLIDLTGQNFGRLTVLYRSKNLKYKIPYWTCECECGNIVDIRSQCLRNGQTKSCGCYKKNLFDAIPKEHIKNKIKDTAYWMLKYFDDSEIDALKEYGIYSNKRIYPICPICKTKSTHKVMIGTLYQNKGFGCRNCGYGKQSIGQRIMKSILIQSNTEFDTEVRLKNSYQRFDFYLPKYNVVIEIDGTLGHGKKAFYGNEAEIKRSIYLDNVKNNYCDNNAIKMIRIDTDSDFNNIFNSISNSTIKDYIDFSRINKEVVYQDCFYSSEYLNIINDYDNGLPIIELSNKYKKHEYTIRKYLRIGFNAGQSTYRPRKRNIQVRCINNGMVFNSAKDACRWCNIKRNRIVECCNGKRLTCGKHPETGEKLKWEYVKTI